LPNKYVDPYSSSWQALEEENLGTDEVKRQGPAYQPEVLPNEDNLSNSGYVSYRASTYCYGLPLGILLPEKQFT